MPEQKSLRPSAEAPTTRPGLDRIRAEYQEMPGLRLTAEQVSRLCGVERTACEIMLDALVDSHYLERARDGRYARPAETGSRRGPAVAPGRVRRSSVA